MITRRFMFTAGGAALLLSSCAREDIRPDGRHPILPVMETQPDLTAFRRALNRAGLDEMLTGHGPFTVFAPTNNAMAGAPPAIREGRPEALRNLIAHGRLRLSDIEARNGRIRLVGGIDARVVGGTAQNPRVQAAVAGGAPSGPSASIVRPNLLCSNGVIHVIDAVLIPA